MEVIADAGEWAQVQFGGVVLGDPRRTRRLVKCAARIAAHPGRTFPQIFDWNELRGFYNLCNQATATLPTVQRPHWERTRAAMSLLPLVLLVHDTSELDFTTHRVLRGDGPIGDNRGHGFLQHNSLAFTADGARLLGLAYQQLYIRQPTPARETNHARKRRERESQLWMQGIAAVGKPPDGSVWVDIGDRGADIYEAMEMSKTMDHEFLFRACQNRKVYVTEGQDQEDYLMDWARQLPARGSDRVEIMGRGGRPPRTAKVRLAAGPVWLPAPKDTPGRKSRPIIPAWVVRIWEPEPPQGVKEPLEWVLLSSLAVRTVKEMKVRRDWYGLRWGVEVYHDVEKNGCIEEDRKFETAERMEACLAVLSVVAVRIYQLRLAVRTSAEQSAKTIATDIEIKVVCNLLNELPDQTRTPEILTVCDFIRAVAKLGGFLGRKGDGEPGVRCLWRGYQRLQDMVIGFNLANPN